MAKMKEIIINNMNVQYMAKNKVITTSNKEETMEVTAAELFEKIYIVHTWGPSPESQKKKICIRQIQKVYIIDTNYKAR